ncbi:MAG: N-acetylneuraminate synthase [Bacteroidota bacterium]
MIQVNNRCISSDSPVFIIAEAGVNHNGSLEMAERLVDLAAEAGADAVKFQTFKADRFVTTTAPKALYQKEATGSGESQYTMLKRLELSYEQHLELVEHCKTRNITFLSTPFDFDSVALLEKFNLPAYKISSGDLTNLPFLEYIATKNKPIILSTGMASLGEVEEAVAAIQNTGNRQIVLLHCTSNYPTEYHDVNLKAMLTLRDAFQLPVGYSDHTVGMEVPIAAVALGACVIEKHFTLDRSLPGPDHRASMEPQELKLLVQKIRNTEAALGTGLKQPTPSEKDTLSVARKSIVAAVDITSGTVVTERMLTFKRPGTGLPPKFLPYLIGRKARKDLPSDKLLEITDFED